MTSLFSILLVQLIYIYLSCIPVFFELWRWLVCLMPFTFGMPWGKKGEYIGKRKPQRAHYSSLVRRHPAPAQRRVAQRFPYFTTGEEASGLCPTMGCPAASRAPQPSWGGSCLRCRAPTAVLQIGGDPAPSECPAHGAGARGRRDDRVGKDAVCGHLRLFNY